METGAEKQKERERKEKTESLGVKRPLLKVMSSTSGSVWKFMNLGNCSWSPKHSGELNRAHAEQKRHTAEIAELQVQAAEEGSMAHTNSWQFCDPAAELAVVL